MDARLQRSIMSKSSSFINELELTRGFVLIHHLFGCLVSLSKRSYWVLYSPIYLEV
jgi:hypothetical protein